MRVVAALTLGTLPFKVEAARRLVVLGRAVGLGTLPSPGELGAELGRVAPSGGSLPRCCSRSASAALWVIPGTLGLVVALSALHPVSTQPLSGCVGTSAFLM